ncbi:extra-large guanine nucleotide-binding protein 1 [Magnolia sinica]|uniref:extra-large guanine nucleotide-binding protein 1 n=1 Tax=Magnolia sinica TaxID=86752 RepID=UPI0026586FB2|nr:extra-large guanine nucleotide-binding protein 1 [Magnolia sinica]
MAGLLRRMLPAGAPIPDVDNPEYSFALEYHGPPVAYDLPRAVPIDINRIPTASVVSAASLSDRLSVPVVQPLPSPDPLKRSSKDAVSGSSDVIVSPTSVIAFNRTVMDGRSGLDSSGALGSSDGHGGSHESSPGIGSSGALGFSDGHGGSDESSPAGDGSGGLALDGHNHSLELSGEIVSLGTLGFPNGHDQSHELSGDVGTSGMLGLSDGHDRSQELLGEIESSDAVPFSNDCKESEDFSNDMNQPDWVSTESVLSSPFPSSESSSRKEEDCGNEPLTHAKRTALVTFRDAESSDRIEQESNPLGTETSHERKEPDSKIRKGSCYRCFKGNRFLEKEACIVCNAKYCGNCVLRAMGSMPEGRKCVTCIGYPIDESKRENLGKCSRMLKRLLSTLEVQQAMRAERSCGANQLQAEDVYVNGKQLSQEEMVLLQACPNPPSKLKPGRYWYDKVSGLWGKEGQKPCMFISPSLNVGGSLMQNASNGNTQIFINNREITKAEHRLLKCVGVQCAGNPHFWLNADGSYQEEGQKNLKGNIWEKTGIKLICSVLSLPTPSKPGNLSEEGNNLVRPDFLEQRILQKLLLVGYHGSGTSTLFKQAKFLFQPVPFSEDERENIKFMIQSNLYSYLGLLLEGRERFEEESLAEMRKRRELDESASVGHADNASDQTIYSIGPRLKTFSDFLLKVMVSGNLEDIFPAATREYAPIVEELWKDAAIQATYSRRRELKTLPSVASYFLDRVVDISRMEYEPSDEDILYAEGFTSSNGLAYTDFLFPQSAYDSTVDAADQHDPLLRYELIRVHARGLGENCKWLEMFEDVRIVIFCVAMSDYDQFCDDGNGQPLNRMLVSKKLFESIVTHPTFEHMDFLLILNKVDLLEQKVEQVPLSVCEWFDDFNPVTSRHRSSSSSNKDVVSPGHQAFHYIAVKFKRLFYALTGRKLYVSMTNGLDAKSVDGALRYAREIMKWEEDRAVCPSEYSVYSTEASSSH